MKIHSSHSKKELVEVVKSFNLDIPDFLDLNKSELIVRIKDALDEIDEIQPEDEYFFVETKDELMEYLSQNNPSKQLTIKEKDKVMLTAKRIIQYSRNGYYITYSEYQEFSEIFADAEICEKFGDIPSCRRALALFNMDPKLLPNYRKLEPVISKRVNKKMNNMKKIKKINGVSFRTGEFILSFD
jgi:hypothetical protein|tara:strand:+ start:981 stop:1535 length:555 start_codon:yes stop_codon:yes gene_type:complete